MLGNSYYHRSFIILRSQDRGYGLREGKEPAGYCKMEIKKNQGKMQLYIQDMMPAEKHAGIYDVLLISSNKDVNPMKMTSIQIEENGRGEYAIAFDPMDLQGTGVSLDKFHVLAIVSRPLTGKLDLKVPLVGFASKRVEMDITGAVLERVASLYRQTEPVSQEQTVDQASSIDEVDVAEEPDVLDEEQYELQPKAVAVTDSEYLEDQEVVEPSMSDGVGFIEEEAEAKDEAEVIDEEEDEAEVIDEEEDEDEETVEQQWDTEDYPGLEDDYQPNGSFEQDSVRVAVQSGSEELKGAPVASSHGGAVYWDRVQDYFTRLLETHKKICPFDEVVGEVDWVRVEHSAEGPYPYYPTTAYHYQSQGPYLDHYLVGVARRKGKVRYVIYGVPGLYSAVPPMSMHGFSRWLPVKNGYGSGYWLLYIDAVTGNIAYPY